MNSWRNSNLEVKRKIHKKNEMIIINNFFVYFIMISWEKQNQYITKFERKLMINDDVDDDDSKRNPPLPSIQDLKQK